MNHHLLCNFMYCTSKIYSYYNKHHQKIPENYSNLLMNNIYHTILHPMQIKILVSVNNVIYITLHYNK